MNKPLSFYKTIADKYIMTETEKITFELSKETFLSFWSFPNPIGKNNNELCDILVVCSPDIIIISVKDISTYNQKRWIREAIEKSSGQIYGAERFLMKSDSILLKDKQTEICLPKKDIKNIYRVSVAFGRGDNFSLEFGELKLNKGFVHVFDEKSVQIVLKELDTITDFIEFLKAKETFINSQVKHIVYSEEDYLTLYLQNGFNFPENVTTLITTGNLWEGFSKSSEYLEIKNENEISYNWDRIIELFHSDYENNVLTGSNSLNEVELCLR